MWKLCRLVNGSIMTQARPSPFTLMGQEVKTRPHRCCAGVAGHGAALSVGAAGCGAVTAGHGAVAAGRHEPVIQVQAS